MDTVEPLSYGKVVRGIGWVSYYLGGLSDTPVCVDVFYVETETSMIFPAALTVWSAAVQFLYYCTRQ